MSAFLTVATVALSALDLHLVADRELLLLDLVQLRSRGGVLENSV